MAAMSALRLLSVVALVNVAVVAGAQPARQLLADYLTGSPGSSSKAKTTSYYPETQLACLAQTNFKSCRYTGCPVETEFDADCNDNDEDCNNGGNDCEGVADCGWCYPDSLYFQTDFACCGKEHHNYDNYGDGEHHLDIGSIGFTSKVGTCDWEISMYRSPNGVEMGGTVADNQESDPWTPHYTDDGTALKWGTAWGTCYLNNNADRCDHPLCERMAITIQGGLYASCAYSPDKPAAGGLARMEEFCNYPSGQSKPAWWEGDGDLDTEGSNHEDIQFGGGFTNYLGFVLTRSVRLLGPTCSSTTIANIGDFWSTPTISNVPDNEGGGLGGDPDGEPFDNGRRQAKEAVPKADGKAEPKPDDKAQPKPDSKAESRPDGKAESKPEGTAGSKVGVASSQDDHHYEHVTYYPSIALMISGPMSISSKKDNKYESTGMFEQSILFYSSAANKGDPTNYWPVVKAKGTKLRFTRHQDQYYEAGSQ